MTQHLTDIQFALERGHVSQIEDAFRALVGWPHEDSIEGAGPRDRAFLLARVCRALSSDNRQMPGHTIRLLAEASTLFGGEYRHGADAVLTDDGYWINRVMGDA